MFISIESSFLLIAVIIIVGFLGLVLFNKTKISDVLLLMFLGLLIGPVLNIFDASTISLMRALAPFFSALVLIMILFESGLKLNFFRVLGELKVSFVYTIAIFAASTLVVAGIMHAAVGWDLLHGLILGAIIGGTSSAIVIPLINRLVTKPETKIMLSLESAFTDALCIIIAIALIQIIFSTTVNASEVIQDTIGALAIAAVIGGLLALFWLSLMRDIQKLKEKQYILTIAMLFLVYFIVEFVHSNGAIAALVFGLVLGNSREIMGFLRMKQISLDTNVSLFQNEISFFIRTFFFIYLGIIFELSMLTYFIAILAIVIGIGLLIARLVMTRFFCLFFKNEKEDYWLIAIMLPRGLAAAVLASLPATMGMPMDYSMQVLQITFLVILISNIIASIGVIFSDRKKRVELEEHPEKKEGLQEIKLRKSVA